jgi:transposase
MASKLKLSDKQFLQALKLNDGRFAETANYIQRKYGVNYSRQSVHERAHRKFGYELRIMRSIAPLCGACTIRI